MKCRYRLFLPLLILMAGLSSLPAAENPTNRLDEEKKAADHERFSGQPGKALTVDLGGGVKMEFVWIPALNGWVGKYEITNGEYRKYKPAHDSGDSGKLNNGHSLNGDRQPVVYVNFDDAKAYAEWLTERERQAGQLPADYRFRLPSEQEWMIFAQCGDGREYPWGNDWPPPNDWNYQGQECAGWGSKIAGHNDGFPVACPVEKSGRNDWDLYGVGGNVWEVTASGEDSASFGAWHGASWLDYVQSILRCAGRYDLDGSHRNYNYGFRLVLLHASPGWASPLPK